MFLQKYKYHGYLVLASLAYTSVSIFTKYLVIDHVNPFNQVFWRIVIGMLFALLAFKLLTRQAIGISRKEFIDLLINAVLFVISWICWSTAITLGTPITKAIAILFSYPISIGLLTWLILKETPSFKNIIALGLSLASVYIILEVWTIGSFSQIHPGDIFVLINSVTFAGMVVWGTKIKRESQINPFKILFYTLLIALPILLIITATLNQLNVPIYQLEIKANFQPFTWFNLIGIGTIGTVVNLALIFFATQKVKTNIASVILLLEIVWVNLFGIILFKEALTLTLIIGTIGILVSVLLV